MASTGRKWAALAVPAVLLVIGVGYAFLLSDVRRLRTQVAGLEYVVALHDSTLSRDERPVSISPLLLEYELNLPGRGEVFPAMLTPGTEEYWPVAVLRVTNSANLPSVQTISTEIPGWSRLTAQSVVIGALETRQVRIQPDLMPRAFGIEEIQPATLRVRAVGPDGAVLYADQRPVLIHGGSEIYWGQRFANAQVTARWVTPHDPLVLDLVAKARAYVAGGRMAGYGRSGGENGGTTSHVRAQARAIYRALQRSGISYVNSLFVMGDYVGQAQRIRLPREVLSLSSANCMDVSVTFASAIENLGMQPLLVIVPGHAFAGVRLRPDSEDILYLDLTVLPNGSFESAIARAQSWLRKTPREQVLVVDVLAARALGIYPLPVPEEQPAADLSAG